jgi:hypothetical protein
MTKWRVDQITFATHIRLLLLLPPGPTATCGLKRTAVTAPMQDSGNATAAKADCWPGTSNCTGN